MNITASLAFSQLKRKRSRTIATLAAILLSTALTTTVCCLVASANEMLLHMMGTDYASYGEAYLAMLLIPAAIIGIFIFAMSVTVISNVFRISAGERLSQFGTLKCVGATGRQIVETVMYEGIFLSIVGIPCGILAGIAFTYLGVAIANQQLTELNSLVNIMINKFTFHLEVVISWQAFVTSAIISFLTVLYSAYRPARTAGKKTTVACMQQPEMTGYTLSQKEKQKSSLLTGPIETGLAFTNIRRNRHNTKSSITVLAISIVLFICLSGLQDIAKRTEEYINPDTQQTVIVDYVSNYEHRINPITGRREVLFHKPIDAATAAQITKELKAYTKQDFVAYGNDYDTYFAILPKEIFSKDMQSALSYQDIELQDMNEFDVEILHVEQDLYHQMCEAAGVEAGSNLLLNSYTYNYRGTETRIVPFTNEIQTLHLELADGTPVEMNIDGILSTDKIPEDLFFLNTNTVRIVVPDTAVRGYSWLSSPEDIDAYIAYAEGVLEKYFPTGESDEYMESGFSTRVYRIDDYAKVMNIAIMIASVFLYSFVILLGLIGMINVISTMSANISMRAREFAVLQSIGMTRTDLEKMLNIETLLCTGKALLYGVPIGMLMILLMNFVIIQIMPIGISVPWLSIVFVFITIFFLIWITIHTTAKKMKEQNIIETIRG